MNEQQQNALEAFKVFMADPDKTLFALLGSAGTGKSYTSARLYDHVSPADDWHNIEEMFWLAPTWKAVRVAGSFLDTMQARYEISYDNYLHNQGTMVLTTTQQALGIRPIISDNQTAKDVEFAEAGTSLVPKLKPKLIVIDEVSMLSRPQLQKLYEQAKMFGSKILIIGDPQQLPPVNAKEIEWDKLPNVHQLTQIMRQASDSAIPHLGAAIHAGEDWRAVRGPGLKQVRNAAQAFLDTVGVPSADEGERDVFIAYRNAVVNDIQERASQKVYGHSAQDFAPGEVVIAQSALRTRKGLLVANQDQLTVLELVGKGEWGQLVTVRNHAGRRVTTEYLSAEEIGNPNHPFNVTLDTFHKSAVKLQADWTDGGKSNDQINAMRKQAWQRYFELKDQTVLSFAHPFAITSHKSQGSSYRQVFMAANDIEQFDKRGLYVAATRPKETLVY